MTDEQTEDCGWIIDALAEKRDPLVEFSERYGAELMQNMIDEMRVALSVDITPPEE